MRRAVPIVVTDVTDSDVEAKAKIIASRGSTRTIGVVSKTVALLWVLGAGAAAFALIGVDGLRALPATQIAGLAAGLLLPALMAWYSGVAAQEGARARAEAMRLADAADRLLNPEQSAELAAKRLAVTVRGEIGTLDKALEQTLARLAEVESAIQRQVRTVDDMAKQAKTGAGHMITGMDRERAELMRISQDLTHQAQVIGDSISRHTKSIADAARLAEEEVRAADQALDHRITSFGAAAALITDRTHAMSNAAQASADSALRLESALSNALDALAKATQLTDAAKMSAEQAVAAANSTAGAVQDVTHHAVEEAQRVSQLLRHEAAGIEHEAALALERLREAAEAARGAAHEARTAIESAYEAAPAPPPTSREPQRDFRRDEFDFDPPARAPSPEPVARRRRSDSFEPEPPPAAPSPQGGWTWRELLSGVDENQRSEPQRPVSGGPRRAPETERPPERLPERLAARAPSEARGGPALATSPVAGVIESAGLRVHEVFSASGLDRIAQRARSGSQARRRAVRDAAPDAVQRLGDHLRRDAQANQEALAFLRNDGARIAELLGRDRAAMGAEATRAFLLIDAAAG